MTNKKHQKKISYSILFLTSFFLNACQPNSNNESITESDDRTVKTEKIVVIQPFNDFANAETKNVYDTLSKYFAKVIISPQLNLPLNARATVQRNRYRADSLICFLDRLHSGDTVAIGLTHKDICNNKNNNNEWGIMGLGFQPGTACVISTARLSRKNTNEQLIKVALHELGHTSGLPHCSNRTCFMTDACGKNQTNREIGFCSRCKVYLKSKGWILN